MGLQSHQISLIDDYTHKSYIWEQWNMQMEEQTVIRFCVKSQ